jgi:hypothetical protein
MNTLLKPPILLTGILTFVCAVALPDASFAQAVAVETSVPLHIVRGQLTETGGEATLSNVVKYLQSGAAPLNVVVPADMGQIKIGDLELRDTQPDLALHALSVASGNQFLVQIHQSHMGAGNPLFILEKNPVPSDTVVQAFSLVGYLGYMKFDLLGTDVMSAAGQGPNSFENVQKLQQSLAKLEEIIKQTIDAQQNFMSSSVGSSSAGSASLGAASVPLKPPTIKFYKDADLLIVVGSPEAVETARKIIDALPGQSVQQTGGGATMGGAAPAGSH